MTWRTHGNGYDDDDDVAVSGDYDATAAADDDDDDDGVAAVTARGSRQHARHALWTRDELGLDSTGSCRLGRGQAASDINKL